MIHGKICMCEDCTVIDLQEELEKAERERDEAKAGQNAHEVNCAKIERKMWRGEATIKRIKALVIEIELTLEETEQ